MGSLQTPKLTAWQDAHRRASEAEHAVFMASIVYAAGGAKPTDLQVETALSLRAMANALFREAMEEVANEAERGRRANQLGPRLAQAGRGTASP